VALAPSRERNDSEQATRGSDDTGTITAPGAPRDRRPASTAAAAHESTTREELIAQALANMGPLTAEQRDQLSLLLPPPAPARPPSPAPPRTPCSTGHGQPGVAGGTRSPRGDGESRAPRPGLLLYREVQGFHHCNRCSIGYR
jgi:hypothetical protein